MVRSWCDCVLSWYGVDVTACIHGTELMWQRAFMVRSWCDLACCWCDSAKSFCVHCTVYTLQLIWRIFYIMYRNPLIPYVRTQPWLMICKTGTTLSNSTKVTLRSWCDLVKWPYGVKKNRIKLLWPVKVTLEVIKRRLQIFCWSCDRGYFKWDKKNNRVSSSSLRIERAYSRLSVRMVGQYL